MTDNIIIKSLSPSDIYPEMLDSFNHKQIISNKWTKKDGHYVLTQTYEVREWSRDKRIWISQYLYQQINRGGYVVGAFSDSKMIGFGSLDGILQGTSKKYANLSMLFVDDEWQHKGIGKSLFEQMCVFAKSMEADKIFISAIPSYETILFYFHMGCQDASYIVESFIDTENDRYLEYDLNSIRQY